MPDQLQLRGGTTTEHNSFTGAAREVTVDTTKKTLVVHDGSQAGGTPLMKEGGTIDPTSLQFGTGGTQKLVISSNEVVFNDVSADVDFRIEGNGDANLFKLDAGNDRIGIGTGNPLSKVNIVDGSDNDAILFIQGADTTSEYVSLGVQTGRAIVRAGGSGSTNTALTFEYSNAGTETEGMRIDSSGFVGIGNTSPNLSHGGGRNLVIGAGSGDRGLTIMSGASGVGHIEFSDGTSTAAEKTAGGIRYYHGSNYMRFNTNGGTERLRLGSTGNLLLGSTVYDGGGSSPKFYVSTTSDRAVKIHNTNTATCSLQLTNAFSGQGDDNGLQIAMLSNGDALIQNVESGALRFSTSATERMRISNTGAVGIGTASPSHALHIVGNVAGDQRVLVVNNNTANTARAAIKVESDGSTLDMLATSAAYSAVTGWGDAGVLTTGSGTSGGLIFNSQASSSAIKFMTQASERMRIHSNGRVSIGTTTANASLHIKSPDGSNARVILDQTQDAANYQNGIDFKNAGTQYAGIVAGKDGSNNSLGLIIHTGTSFTSRLQISDEGIVKTSSSNHALGVSTTASAGTNKYNFRGHHSGTAGSTASGTISFTVWSNGNVENTNNSYGQISDETLKQDIVDASSQWNDIKNITVRKFRFKDNPTGELQIGVVAQEVEKVSAGLVYETGDVGKEVKAVKYSVLYMKAIKALQEAITKIETLETKVAALEAA